jgi:hypothetical protein
MNFELLITIVVGVLIANHIINNQKEVEHLIGVLSLLAARIILACIVLVAIYLAYQYVSSINYLDVTKTAKGITGAIFGLVIILGPWSAVAYALKHKDNLTSFVTLCAAIGINLITAQVLVQIS